LRVLHRDGKPRNILHDAGSSQVMIVDFERAELCNRRPLGPTSPNGQARKRKRKASKKGSDLFTMELRSVVACVSGLAY
jgi:serine/threonine protein kinase